MLAFLSPLQLMTRESHAAHCDRVLAIAALLEDATHEVGKLLECDVRVGGKTAVTEDARRFAFQLKTKVKERLPFRPL